MLAFPQLLFANACRAARAAGFVLLLGAAAPARAGQGPALGEGPAADRRVAAEHAAAGQDAAAEQAEDPPQPLPTLPAGTLQVETPPTGTAPTGTAQTESTPQRVASDGEAPTRVEVVPQDCPESRSEPGRYSTLLLVDGVAKYGGFSEESDPSEGQLPEARYRAGYLGTEVTLGVMPGDSAFTMAGRLRGGAYLGSQINSGLIGASLLFGANFAHRSQGRSFSYALGGFGVEFLTDTNQDLLVLHAGGGVVLRGLHLGAALDVGGNDQVGRAMIGIRIGWGKIL